MKKTKPLILMLTLAQLILLLAAALTALIAFLPAGMMVHYMQNAEVLQHDSTLTVDTTNALYYCLRDAVAGGCLVCAAMEAIGVCGRVKKASAFSDKNASALGRIAIELAIAGAVTLIFGNSLIPFLLQGLPAISPIVEHLLLPFMLLTFAGMLRAVQLLMRRALDMQSENTLTV